MKAGAAARAAAATTIAAVMRGESLDHAIAVQHSEIAPKDLGLYRELCFGTLRFFPRLDALVKAMLNRPLRAKDSDIHALAMLGLYQLTEMRTPAHAAVSATVDAAAVLRKRQLGGMLNALLRRYQRESDRLVSDLSEAAAQAHPDWLWKALGHHWPQQRAGIVDANNSRPPMTLRVNLSRVSRDHYQQELDAAGIPARPGSLSPSALTLETAVDVTALPGFAEGLCSVQDETAQLAAPLLQLQTQDRVLDACAAPGGKSGHLFETQADLTSLTAMDISAERLARVRDNHERLGIDAELIVGDGADPPASLRDRSPFDAIVVDAPCSATGVIRRHPDIKLLRRSSDIAGFAAQQQALLSGLWPLLSPGGRLLYVTCSLLPAENQDVVSRFISTNPDCSSESIQVPGAQTCEVGVQCLQAVGRGDGLYFCLLRKSE